MGAFFWKILDKRFDKIDDKFLKIDDKFLRIEEKIEQKFDRVFDEFKEVRREIHEVKERLGALEAETIVYNLIPDENKRSEAAKRMWDRRRAKRLPKK